MFGPKRQAGSLLSDRAKPAALAGEGFRVLEDGDGERLVWRPGDGGGFEVHTFSGGRWQVTGAGQWLPDVLGVPTGPKTRADIARRFPAASVALPFALRDYNGAPLPGAMRTGEGEQRAGSAKWGLRAKTP